MAEGNNGGPGPEIDVNWGPPEQGDDTDADSTTPKGSTGRRSARNVRARSPKRGEANRGAREGEHLQGGDDLLYTIFQYQQQMRADLLAGHPDLAKEYETNPDAKRYLDEELLKQAESYAKSEKKVKDLLQKGKEAVPIQTAFGIIEQEWPKTPEGKMDYLRSFLVQLHESGEADGGSVLKDQLSKISGAISYFRQNPDTQKLGEDMYREFVDNYIINVTFIEYRRAQDRKTAVGYATSLNTDILNFCTKDSSIAEGRPIAESIALCHQYSYELIMEATNATNLAKTTGKITEALKAKLMADPKRQEALRTEIDKDPGKEEEIRERFRQRVSNDARLAQLVGERMWRLLGRRSFGDYLTDPEIKDAGGNLIEFQVRGENVNENGEIVYKNKVIFSPITDKRLDTELDERFLREEGSKQLTNEQRQEWVKAEKDKIRGGALKAKKAGFANPSPSVMPGDIHLRNVDQQYYWTRVAADRVNLELLDNIDLEGMCALSTVPGKLEGGFKDQLGEFYRQQQYIEVVEDDLRVQFYNGELIINGVRGDKLHGFIAELSKNKKLSKFWEKSFLNGKNIRSAEQVRVDIANRKAEKDALALTEALVDKENGYGVVDGEGEKKHYWRRNNEFDISKIKWKGLTEDDVRSNHQLAEIAKYLEIIYQQSNPRLPVPDIQKLTEIDFTIFSQTTPLGYWGYRYVSSPDGAREALMPLLQDPLNPEALKGVKDAFNYKQDKKWGTLAQTGINAGEFYRNSPVAREMGYIKPDRAKVSLYLQGLAQDLKLRPAEAKKMIEEVLGSGLANDLLLMASTFRLSSALSLFFLGIIKGMLQEGLGKIATGK